MNIDPTLQWQNQNNQVSTHKDTLGKDDFLKLLLTQLQAQDPMDPMQDTQFISQMATFTSLEQTNNMTDLLTQFVNSQSKNMIGQMSNVIGKTVTWQETTQYDDGTSDVQNHTDVITGISSKDGEITYLTKSGDKVDPDSVIKLEETGSKDDSSGDNDSSSGDDKKS
ncbi:hypothetical protein GCM10011391_21200 [Pullulanibacillus camelliae]|uniref:Flagellar hook capping protein n=1 Tax=Pullulanibacillus camelliae TaxID=1707096 RepID=A0A8J2YH98_9BACL|nr:flagellar hook assembly protein FlgD [Pullulanibacillus camelliae]GGE42154.1 hypothetical protein GCM10011391_21200 [Pullulanibacillus camelliae]